jgi:hypothetical protein
VLNELMAEIADNLGRSGTAILSSIPRMRTNSTAAVVSLSASACRPKW